MAGGKLIIEVYEYVENAPDVPPFEYIPCDMESCLKKNRKATLREIIQNGFDDLSKKNRNISKKQEVLAMLDEADIGKINVVFNPGKGDEDPYIQLTNVMQVTMAYADARRGKAGGKDEIILYGRYRMSDENETTILKDSQRLTLIYSSAADGSHDADAEYSAEEREVPKEICLNITYIQG